MIDARHVLGNCLGPLIYRTGVSETEIAARAGISRAQLNRIRNGRAVPRVATALALASVLRCRVKDLFYLKPARSRSPVSEEAG